MQNIDDIVAALHMQPHPEGGFYAETYRSKETIAQEHLPARFGGSRHFSTAIYFLVPAGVFSAFHRIQSDECWHFYQGGPLHVYVIHPEGRLDIIKLGSNLQAGETFQAVVPAGCWFASRPVSVTGYSLVGCTVAPGFDFADFELATANTLSEEYPQHESLIRELCRQ